LEYQPGDKIAFSGYALDSAAICVGTYGLPNLGEWWPHWLSSFSHLGYIAKVDGELFLVESTTNDDCPQPCAIRGVQCNGVQAHRIDERIASYCGKVWHYPLVTPLYDHQIDRSTRFTLEYLGKGYDEPGAIQCGLYSLTTLTSFLYRYIGEEDLEWLFCSELIAAHDSYVGLFHTDNASGWVPNRLIRRQRKERLLRRGIVRK
jgi:hypothetical protein